MDKFNSVNATESLWTNLLDEVESLEQRDEMSALGVTPADVCVKGICCWNFCCIHIT